jgi:hypothetical protein
MERGLEAGEVEFFVASKLVRSCLFYPAMADAQARG